LLTKEVSLLLGFEITKINGVTFVFVANLMASIITLLVFIPQFLKQQWSFCTSTWKSMMRYGLPFVIIGLAGIVNETLDRVLLKYLLPYDTLDERMAKVGIYSAAYKLSIFMNLVVQAFRMGAEPFFFKQAGEKDAKEVYASIMKYFTIFCLIVFLGVSLNLDLIIQLLGQKYHEGKPLVPIILMAYLFLGVFYNLSVWYKVNDKTHYAIIIAIVGAVITVLINMIFIPKIGYAASAWATLWAYVGMSLISWAWGRKYYKVDYPIFNIFKYFVFALGLFFLSTQIDFQNFWVGLIFNNFILLIFISIAYQIDLKNVMKES
jgi:O-antigen/teichoic acid export membrane protein